MEGAMAANRLGFNKRMIIAPQFDHDHVRGTVILDEDFRREG